MAEYQSLFSISVGHLYFSDGLWRGLEFVPSPSASKVLDACNCVVLKSPYGINVFFDEEKFAVLRRYASDAKGGLCFSFKVYASDRSFENYTAPSISGGKEVLCFDNAELSRKSANGKVCLSKDELVSDKDFKKMDDLVAEGFLSEREKRRLPDFLVNIFVEPSLANGGVGKDYGLLFNSRESFWKYYLMGNSNTGTPFIVDLDHKVEFEFCGDAMLPGNKPSKAFRSKTLIPVLEKSNYRFQLRERGQGAGKVLIKRLPSASEGRLGMDLIDGKKEIVLESFIND
jgi:hypothetical protein